MANSAIPKLNAAPPAEDRAGINIHPVIIADPSSIGFPPGDIENSNRSAHELDRSTNSSAQFTLMNWPATLYGPAGNIKDSRY
jgi:hypothetical protein